VRSIFRKPFVKRLGAKALGKPALRAKALLVISF